MVDIYIMGDSIQNQRVAVFDSKNYKGNLNCDIMETYLLGKAVIIINAFEKDLWLYEDFVNAEILRTTDKKYNDYMIRVSNFSVEDVKRIIECPEYTYGSFAPFFITTNFQLNNKELTDVIDSISLDENQLPIVDNYEVIFIVGNGLGLLICNPKQGVNSFVDIVKEICNKLELTYDVKRQR